MLNLWIILLAGMAPLPLTQNLVPVGNALDPQASLTQEGTSNVSAKLSILSTGIADFESDKDPNRLNRIQDLFQPLALWAPKMTVPERMAVLDEFGRALSAVQASYDPNMDIHKSLPYINDRTLTESENSIQSREASAKAWTNWGFHRKAEQMLDIYCGWFLTRQFTDLPEGVAEMKRVYAKHQLRAALSDEVVKSMSD